MAEIDHAAAERQARAIIHDIAIYGPGLCDELAAAYLNLAARQMPTHPDQAQCGHCGKHFNCELMTRNKDGSWCPECVLTWNPE